MDYVPNSQIKTDPSTFSDNIDEAFSRSFHYPSSRSHIVSVNEEDEIRATPSQSSHYHQNTFNLNDVIRNYFVSPSMRIFHCILSYFLLFIILLLALVLLLIAIAIIFPCFLIVTIASLPLLLISLIITRMFQFIKYGNAYSKLTNFKHLIRGWIYIETLILFVGVWIFYPIAKFAPSLKHVTLLDLPLTRWIMIISIALGFYLFSYLIYSLIHRLTKITKIKVSLSIAQAFSELIESLIFWWSKHEIIKRVPTFKKHEILGILTGKWIRVLILIVIGYNLITLVVHLQVYILRFICQKSPQITHREIWQNVIGQHFHRKFIVYFANGIKRSISFLLSSLLLLLTWVLYFGSRLDMNVSVVKRTWEIGLWTSFSIFICSFLWLVKTYVLLTWEAHTVYQRLESKILPISKQLYYLGIIGRFRHDIFKLVPHQIGEAHKLEQNNASKETNTCADFITQLLSNFLAFTLKRATKKLIVQKRETIKNELLYDNKDPTLDNLRRATQNFLVAKAHLSLENYISDVMQNFDSSINDNREKLQKLIVDHKEHQHESAIIRKLSYLFNIGDPTQSQSRVEADKEINDEREHDAQSSTRSSCDVKWSKDWEDFVEKLLNKDSTSNISFEDIQTWVKRAHKECMFLANTLSSAHEVSNCLNKIISWLLIGATFIVWLLLTGFATTELLVIIASPLLAATFIFGDTCKTLFQGMIFVYGVHPYDVGDLCLIDQNMMEVRAIGIWTTRFTKVDKNGTNELVLCPNSDLAIKSIINYKTKFDWGDHAEIKFCLAELKKIQKEPEDVIQHVRSHLTDKKICSFLSRSPPILTISTMEESIKLVIRVEYNAGDVKGWTFSECLRRKDQLKGQFHLFLMKYVTGVFKESHLKSEEEDKPIGNGSTMDQVEINEEKKIA